jgi:hypothetical protein
MKEPCKEFEAYGIDIDDPAFGRWVEGGPQGGHQKWSKEFNTEWRIFFNRNPSRQEIISFSGKMRTDPRFQ